MNDMTKMLEPMINKTGAPHPDYSKIFTYTCSVTPTNATYYERHLTTAARGAVFQYFGTAPQEHGMQYSGFVVFSEELHISYVMMMLRINECITVKISNKTPIELIFDHYLPEHTCDIYGSLNMCNIDWKRLDGSLLVPMIQIMSEHRHEWPKSHQIRI